MAGDLHRRNDVSEESGIINPSFWDWNASGDCCLSDFVTVPWGLFRVIRAGQYIYENRSRLRSWREQVAKEISSRDADSDYEYLYRIMIDILKPLAAAIST
jgi:hypothetical protein